jgi:hypothetical protein
MPSEEQCLEAMPISMRNTYRKAMGGRSRTMAVKAMCQMCVGWENARAVIRECADVGCPLYPYRPYVDRPKRKRKAPKNE